MPQYRVATAQQSYPVIIERGVIARLAEFIPQDRGRIFLVTTRDVWGPHGELIRRSLRGRPFDPLFFVGGEENKRISHVEALAEQMMAGGADRSSVVVAFGGGIVTDMAGFLAAIFMRGVPVIQIPTTLLAQVDAAVGGKTGVNLVSGKNLVGSFHQPLAVLVDPSVIATLPEREYRAGLYEILKAGVIACEPLFRIFQHQRDEVLRQTPELVDHIISEAVRIKAEVVSADEKENGLRRILNFGHTFGHALEAETNYTRFLHGEAVSWGMRAATHLALDLNLLGKDDHDVILQTLSSYGPIPPLDRLAVGQIQVRLFKDKKTIQNRVHFILPVKIGEVSVVSDVSFAAVQHAITKALDECRAS
ncbi:MAG TPA: 3-dehydroquinate synthase [Bryobacteraceae bacterium]|jgi:3-dehydroquinate synthase|nr:3-dehydroquinate synthase [Bryobacteraceae bacterium]